MSAVLTPDYTIVVSSPNPEDIYCYSPGICRSAKGTLIATMDFGGPGVARMEGPKSTVGDAKAGNQGQVYRSTDGGLSWSFQSSFPFWHARPFRVGNTLYVLGHSGDLTIIRSDDDGQTWSKPSVLTSGEDWRQAPGNVHYANGCVYLTMDKRLHSGHGAWRSNAYGAVLLRARVNDDLTDPNAWTQAQSFAALDVCPEQQVPLMGFPFYTLDTSAAWVEILPERKAWPLGWIESHVVQIVDPNHYWYDPDGRTFHILARATTSTTGMAALMKVVEHDDGSMTTHIQQSPSGLDMLYVPLPGGQMKFHILYDEVSRLYWLLSTQAIDSMTRADLLPPERFNTPNDERQRLQLHYSKNCVDWCFAALVAKVDKPNESRHYASMVIDGDDLAVLSRSGDERAKSAHNGNLITFHRIKDFRSLADFTG